MTFFILKTNIKSVQAAFKNSHDIRHLFTEDKIVVHNREDMADFGLPFMALGPLAQERSIQMLKDFYAQQNPNAPVDKVKKRKNPSVVGNKDRVHFS